MEARWHLYCATLIIAFTIVSGQWVDPDAVNDNETNCLKLQHMYAEHHTEFQRCAIQNSEPVIYCHKCFNHFINETTAFRNFTGNDTCRQIYVDSDRLNIIETTHANSRNLWNAGSCSECFSCETNELDANCTLSNTTVEFFRLTKLWVNCTKNYTQSECIECKGHYEHINYMYNDMKSRRGENICFDIKDSMNKTRIKWSKQFHCCEDRNSSLVYFFSLASSMGIIVSIFYGTVFIWGVRNEENGYAEIDDGAPATLAQAVVHPAPLAQAAVHPAPLVSITEDQPPSDNDLYQRANTSSSMFL